MAEPYELTEDEYGWSSPTPPVEPLTAANVELIYEHTGERHDPACPFAIEYGQVSPNVCTCPHIVGQWDSHDKMQATITELRENNRRLHKVISERDVAESRATALATENQAMRHGLERASDLIDEWTNGYGGDIEDDHFPEGELAGQRRCDYCKTDWPCTSMRSHDWLTEYPSARIASLPPVADERTEP